MHILLIPVKREKKTMKDISAHHFRFGTRKLQDYFAIEPELFLAV